MQKQQADLCKPFEMLTGWLYLFFFSVQDWTVSLFFVRLLNNPVKKKKKMHEVFLGLPNQKLGPFFANTCCILHLIVNSAT